MAHYLREKKMMNDCLQDRTNEQGTKCPHFASVINIAFIDASVLANSRRDSCFLWMTDGSKFWPLPL